MFFSLSLKSFASTSSSYSWDTGTPQTTLMPTSSLSLTGYAPYMCVEFTSHGSHRTRAVKTSPTLVTYIDWEFEDHYNHNESSETIINEETESVTHTFCMPGVYTGFSFMAREMFRLYPTYTYDYRQDLCKSGNSLWSWNDTLSGKTNQQTWNALVTGKRWVDPESCIDSYCIPWTWSALNSTVSAVTWLEARDTGKFSKTWGQGGYPTNQTCTQFNYNYIIDSAHTYVTNPHCVITVLEIPPKANLYSTQQSLTTAVSASVIFCADGCVSGSFPIQRIVWDFNDSSELLTVDRFGVASLTANSNIIYNGSFSDDIYDPRNYNVKHVYLSDLKSVYYPSITAYSCNTDTSDCCSTVIGPLSSIDLDFNVINSRCVNNELLIVSEYNNTVCMHTLNISSVSSVSSLSDTSNIPPNPIKNYPNKISTSRGNNGSGFAELLSNKITPKS